MISGDAPGKSGDHPRNVLLKQVSDEDAVPGIVETRSLYIASKTGVKVFQAPPERE
jgi:hypothetical protein